VDELELIEVPRVSADLHLHRILSNFKTGGHQMAIVLDPVNKITPIGIITLEDVLEALIDAELQVRLVFYGFTLVRLIPGW